MCCLEHLWKVSRVLARQHSFPEAQSETFSREAGSGKETAKGEKSVQGIRREGSWANRYLVVLAGELDWTGSKLNLVDIC